MAQNSIFVQRISKYTKLKIIIDSAIPFVRGVFEPYTEVQYLDGKSFTKSDVSDASALLVRTRTRCNKELLEGSSVRHIATATIGFDHIDLEYCQLRQIEVSVASGCNARAVLQWFGAMLAYASKGQKWQPEQKTLGIVGVGNVGSLVKEYAQKWGFKVVCCDPPRQALEGGDFVSLEQLLAQSDIVTFHTPLDASTRHMLNSETLKLCSPNTLIINSSRGEVIDTEALLTSGNPFAMDVWEGEPHINQRALEKALIATPHIAGYSLQGKANATSIAVRNIAKALELPLTNWQSDTPKVEPAEISWEELTQTIGTKFDIESQSNYLKVHAEEFEPLRNNYDYRSEYF